ncbi:MAG: IMPACT family protein [Muribaculaceae bacterium]|nr:IMPACT family protein [Muribaculaceae bacterium]
MDVYYTIKGEGSGKYTEKMSRFLSFAVPVDDAVKAKEIVKKYQNDYHDARHVCWAWMLGPGRTDWQLNDNGEPSGTAGKPILGQINSFGLTNVLVIVVRYFGGIKLGTSGLIAAYREAAKLALDDAGVKECRQMCRLLVEFSYETADGVMKVIKSDGVETVEKRFDNMCSALIEFPLDMKEEITGRLQKVEGVMLQEVAQS